ncbi:hybrid sensor histidine kinase/response regulator [Deltaproteobacteria bacterium TL4]
MSVSSKKEDIVYAFIQESLENLNKIDALVYALNNESVSERKMTLAAIQEISNALQGGSGFFPMPEVTQLAHVLTHLLKNLSSDPTKIKQDHISLIEQTRNLLPKLLEKGKESYAHEIEAILANYVRLGIDIKPPQNKEARMERVTVPDAPTQSGPPKKADITEQQRTEFVTEAIKVLNLIHDAQILKPQSNTLGEGTLVEMSRALGRIKGTASFFKMTEVIQLAKSMEQVLQALTDKVIKFSSEIGHWLVDGKYRMLTLFEFPEDAKNVEIQDLIAKFHTLKTESVEERSSKAETSITETEAKRSLPAATEHNSLEESSFPNVHASTKGIVMPAELPQQSPLPKPLEVAEIVHEFIVEAFEHTDVLEEKLLVLEEEKSETKPQELIDELFRAAHSIKGGSGFFGLVKITKVSHLMENMLEELRTGAQACTPDHISTLLNGVDLLRLLLNNVKDDTEIDITPYLEGRSGLKKPGVAAKENLEANKTAQQPSSGPQKRAFPAEKSHSADTSTPAQMTSSIRVSTTLLNRLMGLAGELVLIRNQQLQASEYIHEEKFQVITQRLNLVTSELQENIMRTRMQPVNNIFNKFPRIVRDLSRILGKKVKLTLEGQDVELDRSILEALSDPLVHLVRNAVDHGIELPETRRIAGKPEIGEIVLSAAHEEGMVQIEIRDDGAGIPRKKLKKKALEIGLFNQQQLDKMSDRDILSLIFNAGFTTAEEVTDVSGRGVGMDVVRRNIEQLGGFINIHSQEEKGTRFEVCLPLTLAIMPTLVFSNQGQRYAIPQAELVEVVSLHDEEIFEKMGIIQETLFYRLREELLPLVHLTDILEASKPLQLQDQRRIADDFRNQRTLYCSRKELEQEQQETNQDEKMIVVLRNGIHQFGLVVDAVLDTEEIVVKPLHSRLKECLCFSGATIMGDGQVALILDVAGIIRYSGIQFQYITKEEEIQRDEEDQQTLLLFRAGEIEQFAIALPLISRIEQVQLNKIEQIGDRELLTINHTVYRVLRLDRLLNVSSIDDSTGEAYLIVAKNAPRPCGVLAQSLIDIASVSADLKLEDCFEPGTLGNFIYGDRLTIFLDFFSMLDLMDHEWAHSRIENKRGGNILLVDPSPMYQTVISGYLKHERYKVIIVETLEKATRLLGTNTTIDLVLFQMDTVQQKDPASIVERLLEEHPTHDIPVIGISQKIEPQQMYQLGFNEVLSQLTRSTLVTCVNMVLDKYL